MIRLRLSRLRHNEDGSIPIEAVFGYLILTVWVFLAFQFYDAFRTKGEVARASYDVADILSRERSAIGPAYIAGMKKVFDFASRSSFDGQTSLRVTLITCGAKNNTNVCDGVDKFVGVDESYSPDGLTPQTKKSLKTQADRIPILGAGDTAVIVETIYRYRPPFNLSNLVLLLPGSGGTQSTFNVGMEQSADGIPIGNFIVTRRRGTAITWDDAS
ncbi:hypothetical protein [Thioclava sp. GXIMD2076]|uniref:Pilus assembly protein n=1 Tax=Thioclava kandeliae TaxID=3070818 RepID=A0ABV1SIN9_9RHOB